jgi:Zn-dependent M28 family amino/carboxypeptidase
MTTTWPDRVRTAGRRAALATTLGILTLLVPACGSTEREADGPDGTAATIDQPSLPAGAEAAAATITAETLRAPIAELASDAYEGRGPGSAGDAKTRQYLVQQMQSMGLEPAGPGGEWEQPFPMLGITTRAPERWTFSTGGNRLELVRRDEFVATSGLQEPRAALRDAELVFVGYGIQAPEYQWDDFKGVDVKGKLLVMLNNDPDWDDDLFAGKRRLYYGRWTYKYESAARQGAAGAIIIHTTPSAGYGWNVVQTSWGGEQFELPAQGEPRIAVKGWVTEDAARKLAQLAGQELDALVEAARKPDFQPVPLGIRTSLALANEIQRTETANVLGRIPGGDLADEHVLFTAHHDHLGIGEPDASGDTIYNGAVDNAAGTAQLLAIARAFKALPQPTRRSLLFAFVAAEEQGLLGSKYFAENPTVPAGKIAAVMNYDGGNIWGKTEDITFVGMEKSSLGPVVERFAAEQGRRVLPDQFPDRGFYYRSDQFSLAKVGVPGVYLDTGTSFVGQPEGWGKEQIEKWEAEKYHQAGDELDDSWNFDGMVDDAQLGFYVALWVAEQDAMPTWTPGDEFEAARKEALAAADSGEGGSPPRPGDVQATPAEPKVEATP